MDTPSTPEIKPTRSRRLYILILLPIALFIAAFLAYPTVQYQMAHVVTDDAFIDAPLLALSPSVPGRITHLFFAEGDTVTPNQTIAKLSQALYLAALSEAEAHVERARSALEERKLNLQIERQKTGHLTQRDFAELVAWQARLDGAESALSEAEHALERTVQLSASAFVSESELEIARVRRDRAKSELQAIQEEVKKATASHALTAESAEIIALHKQQVETARAELKRIEAERDAAKITLEQTEIKSPVFGIVARQLASKGERVDEGQSIYLIRDLNTLSVIANIEETQIRHIAPKQHVDIQIDAFPDHIFHGIVDHVGPVTKSQFALIPRQNRAGNFVKVVQRIPVYITVLDNKDLLKPGMSAVAAIRISPTQ